MRPMHPWPPLSLSQQLRACTHTNQKPNNEAALISRQRPARPIRPTQTADPLNTQMAQKKTTHTLSIPIEHKSWTTAHCFRPFRAGRAILAQREPPTLCMLET